ncbi:Acetyl-coenzyme A transporter 1 family protein [Ancylostoma caninum]|uniref:Acetyl-coenzyme A transporter 1 family protein n=1 Tax=Ancylostoma caninum TaxID=29170 RepID=A0A368GRV5_ANCCA|nr:Acetyl-coenzyme A transporter 1 family protein [Ancylostoma caninum]
MGVLVMANRVRRRNRGFSSSGDVMAKEPDFGFSDAGPHVPMVYRRSDSDDEADSIVHKDVSVDSSGSWFARTRETLRGDISSICLLLFLYLLQGVPLGLIGAIPLLLQGRNVSYGQQAIFSFAYWPFSMKLLWAPVVDSVYWKRIGRRKSWMVPCQYLIGMFMLLLSFRVPYVMGEGTDSGPNVLFLMLIFLPLNFLAATQDIAVDGWALTILSRKNVGYASTCNAVGQTAGYFLGNVVFLSLESADFANTFLRSADNQKPYGVIDLAGFVFFWGWVFIISTTLVLIFKKEVDNSLENPQGNNDDDEKELDLGIVETYSVLWKILRLKPMLWMLVILLTGKIAFSATDGITGLKLIGMGIPKDRLASFGLFLTPLQIMLPWMIGKWTAGPRPLNIFLLAYPYRLFVGGIFAALVYFTPSFKLETGKFSNTVYIVWIIAYILHQVATYCMFVSMMAFNAQVSDPRIGGTYMTLLNTLNNLGGNWPVTLILSVTDWFTYKDCVVKGTKHVLYSCNSKTLAEQCTAGGDVCEVAVDGYYIAVAICSVIGLLWYKLLFNKIKYLQKIPRKDWSVIKK